MVKLGFLNSFLSLKAVVNSLSGRFVRAVILSSQAAMNEELNEVPVHHPPGRRLLLAPNDDLNDDGASSGIPAHGLNVQLEQAMQRIL